MAPHLRGRAGREEDWLLTVGYGWGAKRRANRVPGRGTYDNIAKTQPTLLILDAQAGAMD